MNEGGVLVCLLVSCGLAMSCSFFVRARYASSVALLSLSGLMFSFSLNFLNGDLRWFQIPPPWFVSRIVLLSVALIAVVAAARMRWRDVHLSGGVVGLVGIAGLVIPSTILAIYLGVVPKAGLWPHLVLMFSIVLTVMLGLSVHLAVIDASQLPDGRQDTLLVIVLIVLCMVFSTLGLLEVVLDVGFVRNVFEAGVIETRASSTLQNPNFFALWLVPFVFASLYMAVRGLRIPALVLMAFASMGLIASGSRSIAVLLLVSIGIFFLLGRASTRPSVVAMWVALRVAAGGAVIGLCLGMVIAALVGAVGIDRYIAATVRMVAWPIYVWSAGPAMQSIEGRFDAWSAMGAASLGEPPLAIGSNIVDSAYLFLWGFNRPVLILLTAFFLILAVLIGRNWYVRRDVESSLRVAVFSFVVLAGFVGQFYWAFPVWMVLSAMLGWALNDVMKMLKSSEDSDVA